MTWGLCNQLLLAELLTTAPTQQIKFAQHLPIFSIAMKVLCRGKMSIFQVAEVDKQFKLNDEGQKP